MLPADWIPHNRSSDRELVGWIRPDGDRWTAADLLGHDVVVGVEWLEAEEALEAHGIGRLAEPWVLERADGSLIQVRIVEMTPDRVVVKTDDFGAIDAPYELIELAWPAPAGLRPRTSDDAPASPWA